MNNLTNGDIPMGFGMALAKNVKAMEAFSAMSDDKKRALIDKTHSITSKREMQTFVDSIANPLPH